jgi:opacity protein-like surface antigen
MKKLAIVAVVVAMCAISAVVARAGVEQGINEVSVLGDINRVADKSGSDTESKVFVAADLSYDRFLSDTWSVGGLLKYSTAQINSKFDDTSTTYLMARTDYHFLTDSPAVPYVGLRLGGVNYVLGSDDLKYSKTTIAYGLEGGVKWFVLENVALKAELSYTMFTLSDTGANDDDMSDLNVMLGASLFF